MNTSLNLTVTPDGTRTPRINLPTPVTWYPRWEITKKSSIQWKPIFLGILIGILLMYMK